MTLNSILDLYYTKFAGQCFWTKKLTILMFFMITKGLIPKKGTTIFCLWKRWVQLEVTTIILFIHQKPLPLHPLKQQPCIYCFLTAAGWCWLVTSRGTVGSSDRRINHIGLAVLKENPRPWCKYGWLKMIFSLRVKLFTQPFTSRKWCRTYMINQWLPLRP